ncbi:MFS transporter [Aestuariimicrobium sp. T2.26MG-19.2B]|uniref:MFS transporter n=1 Tax=Aestuariimicrobium sp. T2.26MG-19.2B TaxID=3040679 RepID=UPI0024777957|nr:MFS transporter [Aestuariimicrobium sp. T2.26MG-19.2B]CAI9400214.1 Enterobactin exporter EntS [Aestuariimicrobium sp. T2.26MG-19.2B]
MADRVRTFASFALFNYRLFWLGALVSNVGGWMARVAQDWLVLTQLTDHSAQALGLVTALQFLPIPLIAPMAGALADRYSKRRLLMVTQAALGATAFGLWILVATGTVQLWHAFLFAFLQGVASAFDMPVRQAFVSEMVPQRLVSNAIGLNSAQFNGARLLGPGLAGLLIAWVGIAPALLVNALSFVAVIGALWFMRTDQLMPRPKRVGTGTVREGIAYVRTRPDILLILGIIFVFSTFGMNFQITNALMATTVFGKGASEYGMLGSVMAIGTLGAAFMAARRARPRLRWLLLGVLGFAVFTAGAALAPTYLFFAVMLVGVGVCSLTVMTSCNATVQLASDPALRGRVMAVYMAVNMGGTPIGSPVIGWIGDHWGARWTLGVGAVATFAVCVAASLYVMVHDRVRVRLEGVWPPRLLVDRLDESALAPGAMADPDPQARVA